MMIFSQVNISKMSSHSEVALQKFINDQNISLIALQETGKWKPTDGFFIDKQIIQNKCINDQMGVAIIADKNLSPEHLDNIEDDSVDAVWCQLKLRNKRVIVGSVYTKPSYSTDGLKRLLEHIKEVQLYGVAHKFNSLIVYGDFNARNADWGDHTTNKRGEIMVDFMEKENMTVCSPFNQTFSCTNGGSVIDLVLASGPIINQFGHQWIEKEVELFTGAPARGHYPVLQQVLEPTTNSNIKTKCSDWKNADWSSWSEEVEDGIKLLNSCQDKEKNGIETWSTFLGILQESTRKHIPNKTVSVHSKPFWTKILTEQLRTFLEARKNYSKRSTPGNKVFVDEEKEKFKFELTKAKNEWIRSRTETLNIKDSSLFWKKYKKIFGTSQDNHIGNLIDGNNLVTEDPEKEKVMYETYFTGKHLLNQVTDKKHDGDLLSEYQKVMEKRGSNEVDVNYCSSSELNTEITKQEIHNALEKQQVEDKCTDFDNIHPCVLKKLGPEAISSLNFIFNWSLENEKWIWDTPFITFIRKQNKATYSKPDSYRPLSIASYIGKLFERIIDTRLRRLMQIEGVLDEDQEGFMQGKSTTRYLFRLLANLTEIKRQKLACIILFIDFEKAYDSVHLPTLIVKLERYGVHGKMLRLIQNMLFERKIRIKVNNFLGETRSCHIFGLPQGSVLAPFLFILYITDMTDNIPSWLKKWLSCYKFADDGTLLIVHKQMYKCYRLMQRLCNELAKWCQRNKLIINCDINKTEAIILNTGKETYTHIPPNLYIDNNKIRYVKSTKVLGIILDEDLNFQCHAEEKVKECNKKWGLLTKSTNRNHGLNICSLTLLLKATVLTKMFYAAPIWLDRNLSFFKKFWNKVIMKLTGATLNPHRILSEISLHLPPLEVQVELLTTKFLCKVFTAEDRLTSTLLQIDGSLRKEFHPQLTALKRFIMWKDKTHQFTRIRNIDLCNVNNMEDLMYTKSTMLQYQQFVWMEKSAKQCMNRDSRTNDAVINIIDRIKIEEITLNTRNSIFNYSTTKKEDSFLFDFIHGNSLIFGKCREAVMQEKDICYFCNEQGDSAQHQLFDCNSLKDLTHKDFKAQTKSEDYYLETIIAPRCDEIYHQKLFIQRIKALISKHDELEIKTDI